MGGDLRLVNLGLKFLRTELGQVGEGEETRHFQHTLLYSRAAILIAYVCPWVCESIFSVHSLAQYLILFQC